MHQRNLLALSILIFFKSLDASAQIQDLFSVFEMQIDTSNYSWDQHSIEFQNKKHLSFSFVDKNPVVEIYAVPNPNLEANEINLLNSSDFEVIDSIRIENGVLRFKIRFTDLIKSNFLKFLFDYKDTEGLEKRISIPLFPYTQTNFELIPTSDELFIGEEKILRLTINNIDNVQLTNQWTENLAIDHLIIREVNDLIVYLKPEVIGNQELYLQLNLKKPAIINGEIKYHSRTLTKLFNVKAGRLAFLQTNKEEITPNDDRTIPIEIEIDNNKNLQLNKTYRIEEKETPGGALIAELFTKSRLNNDKILCLVRPYAFHDKTAGYLYIKDGDQPNFVTNFNITPKTELQKIFILRPGKDWEQSNIVYPGEILNIRLEGVGFHKGSFSFHGAKTLSADSLIKNSNLSIHQIKVPIDILSKRIDIFNNNYPTGKSLLVNEYENPKEMNFITIDIGGDNYKISEIDKPVYYSEILSDIVISFDRNAIDFSDQLNGKQEVSINIKVSNKKGNLIEIYQFEQIIVCPSEQSPRFNQYDKTDCSSNDINLNNFLKNKTSNLEEWSSIEIEFKHVSNTFVFKKLNKKVEIILSRKNSFDIDVSFPAGLLTLKVGDSDFSNFSGISFAMIAQMSFYQPGGIAKYKPYKVGAGFIAIDAFNFSENSSSRDVGLVFLGSLYPIASGNKLSFPLYIGFGYLLKDQKPFFLFGPGIRVRL